MKAFVNHLIVVSAVALVTSLFVIASFRAISSAEAEGVAKKNPSLTLNGVKINVDWVKAAYGPDDKVAVAFTTRNTTNSAATVSFNLRLTFMRAAPMMSRMIPIPSEIWTGDCTISLKPGQKGVYKINAGAITKGTGIYMLSVTAPSVKSPGLSIVVPTQKAK
jgi:hypothetical protein